MAASHTAPHEAQVCPSCGLATSAPHESQEGCIAALHGEIDRVRGVLAVLKPTGVRESEPERSDPSAPARIGLSRHETT